MLIAVKRWNEHIKMAERIGDAQRAAQGQPHIARRAILPRDTLDFNLPTERLEQAPRQILLIPQGQRRDNDFERHRRHASSGRSRETADMAVRNTLLSATERNDDAA